MFHVSIWNLNRHPHVAFRFGHCLVEGNCCISWKNLIQASGQEGHVIERRCVPFVWNTLICSCLFFSKFIQHIINFYFQILQHACNFHMTSWKTIPSQQQCRKSTSRLLGAKSTSRKCSAKTKPSLRPRSWTTPNTVSDMSSLWRLEQMHGKKNWLHNVIPWPQNGEQLMCQSEMLELPNQ